MTSLNENGDFQRRPHPALYQVIDRHGRTSDTVFETGREAAEFAARMFPDQEQDPDRTGAGWDVEAVR